VTRTLIFHPADSVLFKDGRPFNQDDAGMAAARSLFPPTPETMMGAVRAALALGQGWDGKSDWSQNPDLSGLKEVLGDRHEPGSMSLSGPFVIDVSGSRPRPLYPAPRHLLLPERMIAEIAGTGASGRVGEAWLRPDQNELEGDVGAASLLDHGGSPDAKWSESADWWLDHNGMAQAMAPRPELRPGQMRAPTGSKNSVAAAETRVGLSRNPELRTAAAGMLYTAARLRLGQDIALAVECEGVPDGWLTEGVLPRVAPFGGEGRFAYLEACEHALGIEDCEFDDAAYLTDQYVAILVTPARLGSAARSPGAKVGDLPGNLVAAATGRGLLVGGWNGVTRRPERLEPVVPAGAVLFMKGAPAPAKVGRGRLGDRTEWGYGRYVVAGWPAHAAARR
jgi:CRISPR-associated protein Cmr3